MKDKAATVQANILRVHDDADYSHVLYNYVEIFKGRKNSLLCKPAERKVLILKKKQWLKAKMYST